MATVVGKVTQDFRSYFLDHVGNIYESADTTNTATQKWHFGVTYFRYGEGGWIDPGSGRVQRTPVDDDIRRASAPLIQDLDAAVDSTRALIDQRYPSDSRAVSSYMPLTSGDITKVSARVLEITCTLDLGDFNDDGLGNNPEIWELGIYMDHPTQSGQKLLVFYGTLSDKQTKTSAAQLSNTMRITF